MLANVRFCAGRSAYAAPCLFLPIEIDAPLTVALPGQLFHAALCLIYDSVMA